MPRGGGTPSRSGRANPAAIHGENPRLPGVALPDTVRVTGTLGAADATLVAVPMQHLRAVLAALRPEGTLVLCCKGIETGSLRLPLEVAARGLAGRGGPWC